MTLSHLSDDLLTLQKQGAYRQRKSLESPQGVEVIVEGKPYLSFCSNDYLGLANDARVCNAATRAISNFGVGSGGSQLISGYSCLHAALEEALADFLGYERTVLFSSGYLANLGVISAFSTRKTLILEDRFNHASLIDAAKYAGGNLKRYLHRDTEHAKNIASQAAASSLLLVTDGVFSMEGTMAPLKQLCDLKDFYADMLIVDDAHGIGVLGQHGRGTLEQLNIDPSRVDILVGTFGKAFGGSGAFVAGSNDAIEYLIQKSRTLIYTTAAPAALAAAAQQSLDIIINEPDRRDRLHNNIEYFRKSLNSTTLNLQDSNTAIQTIVIGTNNDALRYSEQLEHRGLLVLAIRPPTVPKNTARLRITLCSEHTHKQIDQLVLALQEIQFLNV